MLRPRRITWFAIERGRIFRQCLHCELGWPDCSWMVAYPSATFGGSSGSGCILDGVLQTLNGITVIDDRSNKIRVAHEDRGCSLENCAYSGQIYKDDSLRPRCD